VWSVTRSPSEDLKVTQLPLLPEQRKADDVGAETSSAVPIAEVAAQVAPATVQLSIKATPPDATIYMDGQPLGNPYRGQHKVDGELHLIRVSAPGAQAQERVLVLDRDKVLEFTLSRREERTTSSSRARRSSQRGAKQAEAADSPKPQEVSARRAEPGSDFDTDMKSPAPSRVIYEEDPY
jgi:hypothetical protein